MRSSGDHVLLRNVHRGRVVSAYPCTVVSDDDEALVTWIAPETPIAYPEGLDDAGNLRPVEMWPVVRRTWTGVGVLDIAPPGRAHMIRLFRDGDGALRGWYVNLQEPLRREGTRLVTMDHQLDLWIEPDGTTTWKDEHHLAQSVELGMLTDAEAAGVRVEAERVLAEWPFPTGWEDWQPPPRWRPPELPDDWHVV